MNRDPLALVTDPQVDAFQRDGMVHLKGVVESAWLAKLEAGVERNIANPGPLHTIQTTPGEPGFFLSDICMSQQVPEFRDFMLNGPAPAIAARLMRAQRVNFFADTLWVKDAGTTKRTRWHQDQPFFWVDGQMTVIWFPLDPVAKDNSLELVRGSHTWNRWFAPELSKDGRDLYRTASGAAFERMPDIEAHRSDYEILSWAVEPGDCIAFNGLTVHGAPGNQGSSRRRRALSSIWMGDDARYAERPSPGRPHFEGHGLKPGDAMDCGYFPRVWPRPAPLDAGRFSRFTDAGLQIRN